VLNIDALRLCRALGLPPEKLRRWSEDEASGEDDWRRCSSLCSTAAATRSIMIE